jgi:hypothetical protein
MYEWAREHGYYYNRSGDFGLRMPNGDYNNGNIVGGLAGARFLVGEEVEKLWTGASAYTESLTYTNYYATDTRRKYPDIGKYGYYGTSTSVTAIMDRLATIRAEAEANLVAAGVMPV